MSIDRNSPVPLYYQLKQLLAGRIENGEWLPGDMFPTEEQLQKKYKLSRTTIRQALRELELEEKITRFRGRGTFISKPKIRHSPEQRLSLADYLHEQGMQPGWRVLSAEWLQVLSDVAQQLHIDESEQVYALRRLRLANDEPIGYHIAYVSPLFAEAIDEDGLAKGGSLSYLSRQDYLEGSYADRSIEAIPASGEVAELLEVEKGTAMLLVRRLVMSKDGVPIEDFRGIYRGDRFQYHIRHLPAVHPINA